LTPIVKVEKLWPIVSGKQHLPMAATAVQITIGTSNLPSSGTGSISLWEDQDALALTIINNYFENSIVSRIQSCQTSNVAWSKLMSIF